MLKIGINTGTAWLQTFEVEGTKRDDIGALIEEYVLDHKHDFARYTMDAVMELCGGDFEIADEEFYPINGGDFYVGRIELIEEI